MELEKNASPDEARFNVIARLPEGRLAEDIRPLALAAGIAPARVDALVNALGAPSRAVRVGVNVTTEKADKAKQQFSQAGLEVVLEPVLTLALVTAGQAAQQEKCPACGEVSVLPPDRKCPKCGVYVDKVSPEAALKRKILEQERARIAQQLGREDADRAKRDQAAKEEALRMKIRAELEAEFGLRVKPSLFSGRAGTWRAIGLVVLVGGAFGAGLGVQMLTQPQLNAQNGGTAPRGVPEIPMQVIDRVMGSLTAGDPSGGTLPALQAATGVAALAASGVASSLLSGEESLTKLTDVQRQRGQAPGVETLAWRDFLAHGQKAGVATAADAPADAASGAQGLLSPIVKTSLVADFAVKLAELGQLPRAQEIVGKLKAMPEVLQDPAQAATARLAEFQVNAWAVRAATRPVDAAETLRSDLLRLPDPAQRAVALGRTGAILAAHHGLPAGLALGFVLRGGDALKAVSGASQRTAAAGDWLLSMGQVIAEDVREHARVGHWSQVEGLAEQLDALAAQAQGSTPLAGLRGLQAQVRRLLSQPEAEEKVVKLALREMAELSSPLARAEALRSFGRYSGDPGQARVQAALRGQVTALESQKGVEVAYALARLSLLQADAGQPDAQAALMAKAVVVPGLTKRESVTMDAELMVGAELAQAEQLHRAGRFGAAEQQLRQLAYKLL